MKMIIYRASELGGCTKYLICKRLGYEPMQTPESFEKVFEAGRLAETEVIAKLLQDGDVVTGQQQEVNVQITEEIVLQGHIDGELEGRVLEIKSMSEAEFQKFKATRWDTPGLVQRYKWQLSSYMVAKESEALCVIFNRDTGEILREGIELPWYGIESLRERVLAVEHEVERSQIPTKCDIPNYPCPFYYLHEEEEVEVDERLEPLGIRYEELRQQEKKVKDSLQSIRADIIKVLGDRTKLRSGSVLVSNTDVVTKRFNEIKAREDGVEVDRYMESKKSTRLNVKVEKAEEEDGVRSGEGEEGG